MLYIGHLSCYQSYMNIPYLFIMRRFWEFKKELNESQKKEKPARTGHMTGANLHARSRRDITTGYIHVHVVSF